MAEEVKRKPQHHSWVAEGKPKDEGRAAETGAEKIGEGSVTRITRERIGGVVLRYGQAVHVCGRGGRCD